MKKYKILIALCLILCLILPQTSMISAEEKVVSTLEEDNTGETSSGLIVKLYASRRGMSGYWINADMLGIAYSLDGTHTFNMNEAIHALGINKTDIKRIRLEGKVKPRYKDKYTLWINGTNENKENNEKIWINNNIIKNRQSTYPTPLEADKLYDVTVECFYDGHSDYIDLKWYSELSQEEEVIPYERLFSELIQGSDLDQDTIYNEMSNPLGDADGDIIPNAWEINGYTVVGGIVVPYDASFGTPKYITDYNHASTDKDPYTDYQETTGIGMDRSVTYPGNHPLVPAYPEVEFVPTSIKIINRVETTEGESITNLTSTNTNIRSVDTVTESDGDYKKGFAKVGIEVGIKTKTDTAKGEARGGGFVKTDVSGGAEWNSHKGEEIIEEDGTIVLQGNSEDKIDKNIQVIDNTKYANLYISGHFVNRGTAPIRDINPIMSLEISGDSFGLEEEGSGEVVKTFPVISEQRPSILSAESRYPANDPLTISLTNADAKVPIDIVLNKSQTEKLQAGFPMRAYITSYNGTVDKLVDDPESNDPKKQIKGIGTWELYQTEIDDVSADISLKLPKLAPIRRKIAISENITMNLRQALEVLFDSKVDSDGNLVIEGETITTDLKGNWGLYIEGAESDVEAYIQKLEKKQKVGLEDIMLTSTMSVKIYKKEVETAPSIISAYYSPHTRKIVVGVIPSGSPIQKVKVEYSSKGKKKTLDLQLTGDNSFTYESDIITTFDGAIESKVIATAENGISSEQRVYVGSRYRNAQSINGLGFVKINTRHDMMVPYEERRQYILDRPNIEYFLINVGFTTSSWATEHYAKIGQRRPYPTLNTMDQGKLTIGSQSIYEKKESFSARPYETFQPKLDRDYVSLTLLEYGPYEFEFGTDKLKTYYLKEYSEADNRARINTYSSSPSKWVDLSTKPVFNIGLNRYPFLTSHEMVRVKALFSEDEDSIVKHLAVMDDDYDLDNLQVQTAVGYQRQSSGDLDSVILLDVDLLRRNSDSNFDNGYMRLALVHRDDLIDLYDSTYLEDRFNLSLMTIDLIGGFTRDSDNVFIYDKGNTILTADKNSHIIAPHPSAEAYLMNFRKDGGYGKHTINLNDGVRIPTYTSNSKLGSGTGNYDHQHQQLAIAYPNADNNIKYRADNPFGWNFYGYFVDKDELPEGATYWQFWGAEHKIRRTIMPIIDYEKLQHYPSNKQEESLYIPWRDVTVMGKTVKPQAYILKVDQVDMGTKDMKLTINGEVYDMDIGMEVNGVYSRLSNTSYVFVKSSIENPYKLDVKLDIGANEDSITKFQQGELKVEVIGFFYENEF